MANEEVLGPRKTMFVLVIVVGCFAVLWPRILSPLILGHTRDQLKPNQFDREAGCCEVMFEKEVALLELLNEVCGSIVHANGKLSPYAAAECRKTVNETCGVDIAAFIKRDENVGKTTKKLLEMMKTSNSSCLKEHFGVPQWSISNHVALNTWTLSDTVKQERPPMRVGPHPALKERGRAIPPGGPPPNRGPIAMPPHVRVRSSPLDVYFEIDIKPPPIPGMRPPLGSPGGPVAAPKSSMGFVMPIYTICIIVFFVYTLSKILFKRTGSPVYESVDPDPQFRRRVFRDDSRTSPDKLVVTAISGLVAEVQQQMEASYAQNQQRQEPQDNHARPYTNGTVLHNTGPVHIVASEYRDKSKERSPAPAKEPATELKESEQKEASPEREVISTETKEQVLDFKEPIPELEEPVAEPKESTPEPQELIIEEKEPIIESQEESFKTKEETLETQERVPEPNEPNTETLEAMAVVESNNYGQEQKERSLDFNKFAIESKVPKDPSQEITDPPLVLEENLQANGQSKIIEQNEAETNGNVEAKHEKANIELLKLTENMESVIEDATIKTLEDFLNDAKKNGESQEPKQSTPELLEEALKEESPEKEMENEDNEEKASVKHVAEEVKAIYLEGDIPQQSRVLVAEFEDRAQEKPPTKHSPTVVSGKMTLSLIQDAPRETPERDLESTVDDFTTASGITQPAEGKEEDSEEEVEEEIEVEEIEEEVEEVEEEEVQEEIPVKTELLNSDEHNEEKSTE